MHISKNNKCTVLCQMYERGCYKVKLVVRQSKEEKHSFGRSFYVSSKFKTQSFTP